MSTNKKTLPTPANQECTFRGLEQSGRRCWQLVRTHTSQNSAARLAVAKFSESECLPAVKSKRVERPGFEFRSVASSKSALHAWGQMDKAGWAENTFERGGWERPGVVVRNIGVRFGPIG